MCTSKEKVMATSKNTVDYLLEQIAQAGNISARKMFGEYALYCDGKVVALICDDEFYLKPTTIGKKMLEEVVEGAPFPGAKMWYLISGDQWEDGEWLSGLIRATASELPLPKPKKMKIKKKK